MKWKWIIPALMLGSLGAEQLDEVLIPRKTTIFVNMGRTINSKTAQPGDKFFALVSVPVTMNDQVIMVTGTCTRTSHTRNSGKSSSRPTIPTTGCSFSPCPKRTR